MIDPSILINSRRAIAEATIGLLLVFYNSKNLNCIGALCFFFKDLFTHFSMNLIFQNGINRYSPAGIKFY